MKLVLRCVQIGLFWSTMMPAQPKFEVASVRPSVPGPLVGGGAVARSGGGGGGGGGACPQRLKIDASRVDIACATPIMLIAYAYQFASDRIRAPQWMTGAEGGRFDLATKIPAGVSPDQVPEMVKALLAERFGLVLHRGTTAQPIYALVATSNVVVMRNATDPGGAVADSPDGTAGFAGGIIERTVPNADGRGETNTISSPQMGTVKVTELPELKERIEASSISLTGVAEMLERMMPVDVPIVNQVGWKGRYSLVLDVSLNGLPKLAPASIGNPAAVADWEADREEEVRKRFNDGLRRYRLQLERRRGPVELLFVDHWERMPTGN